MFSSKIKFSILSYNSLPNKDKRVFTFDARKNESDSNL